MDELFKQYECIGIMGGTFNPIHNGHIIMARNAYEQYKDIEKIIFMPNNLPKYKDACEIISTSHRINMITRAIESFDWAEMSDMEIQRGGTTYTVDTLTQIKNINPSITIYFIIGADSLYSFEKWFKYRDILKLAKLLVASRNSDYDDMVRFSDSLISEVGYGFVDFIKMEEYDAASSEIRKMIGQRNMPFELMPQNVSQYIINNNLYGWK